LFESPLMSVMNGLANNTPYEIDMAVAGVPYPPQLKPEPQWFVTHHTQLAEKPGGRDSFLKRMKDLKQMPELARQVEDAGLALGFYRCALMPVSAAQEGPDGPMFCVWEAKPGTTVSEMASFLDSICFPITGCMSSVCHPIEVNPMAQPYPVSKMKGQQPLVMPAAAEMGSKFFVLHHTQKSPGANETMLKRFGDMGAEAQTMMEKAAAAGFVAHSSMHSLAGDGSTTFCVWETPREMKRTEMEAFFESPLFTPCNGLFINQAYEIDASAFGVPYPPKMPTLAAAAGS